MSPIRLPFLQNPSIPSSLLRYIGVLLAPFPGAEIKSTLSNCSLIAYRARVVALIGVLEAKVETTANAPMKEGPA